MIMIRRRDTVTIEVVNMVRPRIRIRIILLVVLLLLFDVITGIEDVTSEKDSSSILSSILESCVTTAPYII